MILNCTQHLLSPARHHPPSSSATGAISCLITNRRAHGRGGSVPGRPGAAGAPVPRKPQRLVTITKPLSGFRTREEAAEGGVCAARPWAPWAACPWAMGCGHRGCGHRGLWAVRRARCGPYAPWAACPWAVGTVGILGTVGTVGRGHRGPWPWAVGGARAPAPGTRRAGRAPGGSGRRPGAGRGAELFIARIRIRAASEKLIVQPGDFPPGGARPTARGAGI